MSERPRRDPSAAQRWRRRPWLAFLLRLLVFLTPIAVTLAVSIAVSRALPSPSDPWHEVLWWTAVVAVSLVAFLVADRLCRRALPLVALLQLSMLFPDRAPRRFKVARGRGRVKDLTAELSRAVERDPGDPANRGAMTVLTLIASLTVHDGRTRGHSERVRIFADMIAEEMGISEDDRYRLRWAALLHDIGKLEVPASILNKPGRPDDDEWVQLRRHPETAARLLTPLHEWLGVWKLAAEQHHEHYDGTGYPRRLQGDEISLGGRIVCVADCFETMTAARPYKKTMTAVAAREELVRNAGTQFDPVVCRAFLNISLGRLWLGLGLAAWLGQLPLLAPFAGTLSRWGGQAASMTATVASGVAVAAAGLLAIPSIAATVARTPAVSRLHVTPSLAPAPVPAPAPAFTPTLAPTPAASPAPSERLLAGVTGGLPVTGGAGGPVPGARVAPSPGRSGGDAYALLGAVGLLPAQAALGPVAPVSATAPPSSGSTARAAAAGCGPGTAACPPGIDEVSLGGSGILATTEAGMRPDCGAGAPPDGFETGPLTPPAAAACTSGLRVVALGATLGVVADGVAAESVTQGCGIAPAGHASLRDLQVGGRRLIDAPTAPAPNTRLSAPVAGAPTAMLVVLDEQVPDPTGRGLTVNAIHISGGALDLIIGHVHTAAACPAAGALGSPTASQLPALLLPLLVPPRTRRRGRGDGRGAGEARRRGVVATTARRCPRLNGGRVVLRVETETAGCFDRLCRSVPPDRVGQSL